MKLSFWDILASMVMLGGLALATIFVNIFVNPYTFINPFPPPTPVAALNVPTLTASPRSLPNLWTSTPETTLGVTSRTPSPTATVTGTRLVLPTATVTRTRTPLPTATKTITLTPNRTLTSVAYKTATRTSTSSSDTTAPTNPGTPTTSSSTSDSTPTFTWTASSDSGSGVDYYQITWGTSNECGGTVYTSSSNSWTSPTITTNTTYYICVRARDNDGNESSWVGTVAFYYSGSTAPIVTTNAASLITTTSATLNGTVNANTLSTTVTFQYGLTTAYGTTVTATQSPVSGSTNTSVSYALSGLTLNTTYHFRVVAVNSLGTTYGSDVSFTTNKNDQTISFTSSAPGSAVVGGTTYTPTATATSGLAVTFTIDATAASVCSISSGIVSFQTAGTCVINANQAGNSSYNAAPQVQQSFAVGKGAQTITFTSTAPGSAVVGGVTYTPTATSTSGLAVSFTIDATASSVCSISGGGVVSFLAVGNCVIDANQAGDANYNAATQVQQSFAVGKGAQTITFTSTAPGSAVVAGATYTPTATATSGLTVTFTIDPTASSVCSISGGGVVSFLAVGNCVIDANQAGDANYNAATQVQQSFAVGKGAQTITFTSTAPGGAVVAGATYTPTATATSGLTVTFTIDPTASSVCSISGGGVVSFLAVGNCVIDANQAGDANYNAATQVQQSFAVGKGDPDVTAWPTASGITSGQTLASSTLTGGSTSTPGTFTFTDPSIIPPVGTNPQSVTFTPDDTTNYNTVIGSVSVTVS